MTRITFQFIPSTPVTTTNVKFNRASNCIQRIDELEGGLTAVHFQNDTRLEYDIDGNLRYSATAESISEKVLDITYKSAVEAMKDLYNGEQSYRVCLILNDKDAIGLYLDEVDDIKRFAEEEFNSSDPVYTELGDETIKVSFGRDGRPVVL